jgi:Big-like domain-containing protein
MRTSVRRNQFLGIILLMASLGASQAQVTNWVAYNDQVPNYTPVNGWVTHPRTTAIDMGEGGGTGNLTNFLNGQQLPVVMSSFHTGPLHNFGLAFGPLDNTPAARIFKGIVDVSNEGSAQPGGNLIGVDFNNAGVPDYATITFSGLDPSKRYIFRGTAVRGGPYGNRWTVATIIGAQTFVNAHINGAGTAGRVLTANDYPASLEPGQAAWNAGDNRVGAVVGWDFITPSPEGTFSVQSTQYIAQIPGGVAGTADYSYGINAMLLAEVEIAPPVITQQPAAETRVEQNRPFTLEVTAAGTPLFYQWYKVATPTDTAIGTATFRTYSVPQAALTDAGNYYVVVYNPLDRKTSTVAHVTVDADVTGPSIATAFTYPTVDFATQVASLNQVVVEFNERIQTAGATDPTKYSISGTGNPASVVVTNDSTVVLQLSTALAEDTPYTVQVSGIVDLVGNDISNGGTNNPAPFRSWASGPGNGLMFEVYDGIGGGTVPSLTNSPLYPNNPTFRTNLWAFDSRLAFPDDTRENYGSRIRGVFIPPVSGDWVFYMRGIDRCNLYLNPDGLDEAGKQFLREEQQENNDGNWGRVVSNPVSLRAGRGYYIETLHKSDTGIDFIKVAARLLGAGTPPGVPNIQLDTNTALFGAAIAAPLAPRDLGGTLTIAQGPVDTQVENGHIATLSVQVNNPSGAPVTYRWYRNDVLITSNAFAASYSFIATDADNQAVYRVEASKIGSSAASGPATLTVVPDNTPPHVTGVTSSYTNLSVIIVHFDEFVDDLAADEFSYALPGSSVDTADLLPDGMSAILGLGTPLVAGQTYELSVSGVNDLAGNTIVETNVAFVAAGDLPRLAIELVPDYVNLTWPAPSTGFVLQQASDLAGSSWTDVGTPPIVVNGRNFVSLFTEPGNKFYRLRRP